MGPQHCVQAADMRAVHQVLARWAGAEGKAVYSSLELSQVLLLNTLPNCTITLSLNHQVSEMTNDSVSRLGLLRRPSWSMLLLEHVDILGLCCPEKPC